MSRQPLRYRPVVKKRSKRVVGSSAKRTLTLEDRQKMYLHASKCCEGCQKRIDFSAMQVVKRKGGAITNENAACVCGSCKKLQGAGTLNMLKKAIRLKRAEQARRKKMHKGVVVHSGAGTGGALYGLGFIGAAVYYISTAAGFWAGVVGFVKAIFWPGFLVYGLLKFVGA